MENLRIGGILLSMAILSACGGGGGSGSVFATSDSAEIAELSEGTSSNKASFELTPAMPVGAMSFRRYTF